VSTWDNEPEEDRAAEAAGAAPVPGHDRPLEADEADVIDQAVTVATDDDDTE
jgi:hypothetical protein